LQDSVQKEGVKLGQFSARRTLYFELATKVKMIRQWVRPDNTEMVFIAGTGVKVIAWHGILPSDFSGRGEQESCGGAGRVRTDTLAIKESLAPSVLESSDK